jgi:hypothetical protein
VTRSFSGTEKNTLQQCIPCIRFHNLTSKEFLRNILPYREILPEGLYTDLLKYFLNNDYSPSKKFSSKSIDSVIISNQHVELISKWINKLEITDKTNSYEFKLLYRDSRDGSNERNNRFKKFHEICHNQTRTIIIVKTDEILGGYNPIEWKSDVSYSTTKDSFIFSFINNDIENFILSHVVNEEYAICNSSFNSVGPSFGGSDLHLYQNCFSGELIVQCIKNHYDKQIRRNNVSHFSELEVFKIV